MKRRIPVLMTILAMLLTAIVMTGVPIDTVLAETEDDNAYALVNDGAAGNPMVRQITFVADATAPTVVDRSPVGDDEPIGAAITVTFSEAMNQSSVIMLVNGVEVALDWNGNTATYTPSSALAYGTEYTIVVAGENVAGNALDDVAWTFTTEVGAGTITGTVEDEDGDPMAGANVSLGNGMKVVTDATGGFVLSDVPAGSYTLTVSKSGYISVSRSVIVAAEGTNNMGALVLVKDEGSISGQIKDQYGNDLVGITVSLENGMTTVTNQTGHFMFEGTSSGSHTLSVSADGYVLFTRGVTVVLGETTALGEFGIVKKEGAVAGVVKDSDGNPIANATVTLSNGANIKTNATGVFSFSHVPSGTYTLTVTKDGYDDIARSVTVLAGGDHGLGTLSLVSADTADKGESDNTLLYAGIVAAIVIVGGIGAFLFLKRKK